MQILKRGKGKYLLEINSQWNEILNRQLSSRLRVSVEKVCELECKYDQITNCGEEWKEMENTTERLRNWDISEMVHRN